MYKDIKKIFSKKPTPSRVERIDSFGLDTRPVTKALLFRDALRRDKAEKELKEQPRKSIKSKEPKNLERAIDSAIISEAYNLTANALRGIGRHDFLSHESIPKDASLILTFTLYLCSHLCSITRQEGYSPSFLTVGSGACIQLFHAHDQETTLRAWETIVQGSRYCDYFAGVNHPNVTEWQDNLLKLFNRYQEQLLSTETRLMDIDLSPAFGSMLESLLVLKWW